MQAWPKWLLVPAVLLCMEDGHVAAQAETDTVTAARDTISQWGDLDGSGFLVARTDRGSLSI